MQVKKGKKKWVVLGAIVAAASILMASTYLWFSTTQKLENVLDMDLFDVVITESFDETTPVVPGVEINKDVGVENKSKVKVAVRMQLVESLQLLTMDPITGNPAIEYREAAKLEDGEIMVTVSQNQIDHMIGVPNVTEGSGYKPSATTAPDGVKLYERVTKLSETKTQTEYFAFVEASNRLVKYEDGKFTYAYYKQKTPATTGIHGKTGGDPLNHQQIQLKLAAGTKWKVDAETGWYYYTELLNGGAMTEYLVDAVKFSENLDNEFKGAVYTLTPTLSAVQAKDAAVKEVWSDAGAKVSIDDDTETLKLNF